MSLSLSNESKNTLNVSNEAKDESITWDEATMTWDESNPMTWDSQGTLITRESKNSLTITNENKN